jgi:hypothetical protein
MAAEPLEEVGKILVDIIKSPSPTPENLETFRSTLLGNMEVLNVPIKREMNGSLLHNAAKCDT